MEKIRRINECPGCGANVASVDPTSLTENKCPYCGYELYNHSKEIYDEKIEDVKRAKSKLITISVILGCAAIAIALVAVVYVANRTAYRSSSKYQIDMSDNMTKKLQKAYEKEDWDTMYDLVILNADKALSSPYYFSYRAAWMMSEFVPAFDRALEADDNDGLLDAFDEISLEYEYREQLADVYEFVPEIEENLEKEYLREKEIVESRGLKLE